MNVLVLNCGSSSVKFQLIDTTERGRERRLAGGTIERIGEAEAAIAFRAEGHPAHRETAAVPDHATAVQRVADWVATRAAAVGAVGHRVVHGGPRFTRPTLVDDDVTAGIEALETLAPLHNAPSLAGIRAARRALGPEVPMVAVFDTAFHATLPDHAARYALPEELVRRHAIRRYGFHGTSYRSVLLQYGRLTGTSPERATLIALHLGNGCSVAAIRGGQSVDTSMGFTPLEGLVMGTRAGDLDPAIVSHLARAERVSPDEVERWLNERSGLLGVSGHSRDMRALLDREREDPRARLAVEIFCYRAKKYIGAYLAALGGAESVVFTGGIGEHAPEVRARICAGMEWCGLVLDPERNARLTGEGVRISGDQARIRAFVIPTDEELVIGRDTIDCLKPRA
ncbi:MAG TPA: acetate kinase [Methylomirabilota bacterium]|nr:acetate kinase [Methylomirabilota bacterium]